MKKVLIIEDEKILAEMYQERFQEMGCETKIAFNAREGLSLTKKEKPDLIILDILLPRENGIFFLEEMKRDNQISSIPVIAFSNFDDPETKKRVLELGVKEYLLKTDYTPKEFIEKIKNYLK